jgi:hypothetical protein
LSSEAEIDSIIGRPNSRVLAKVTNRLDDLGREFIGASPFLVVSSSDSQGRMDCSPKGDPAGLVQVLDEHRLRGLRRQPPVQERLLRGAELPERLHRLRRGAQDLHGRLHEQRFVRKRDMSEWLDLHDQLYRRERVQQHRLSQWLEVHDCVQRDGCV